MEKKSTKTERKGGGKKKVKRWMRDGRKVMVMGVWHERRKKETDELLETETEGQLLGFETYARQ